MPKLTATFEIGFPQALLMRGPTKEGRSGTVTFPDRIQVEIRVGDFDVRIQLIAEGSRKGIEEKSWVSEINSAQISVTRMESESPPGPIQTESGRDLSELTEYLRRRHEAYESSARAALNGTMRYFRFVKGNPLLRSSDDLPRGSFGNPTWIDENGQTLANVMVLLVVPASAAIRMYPHWGIEPFGEDDREALLRYLEDRPPIPLYREILAETKDAVASNDFRRAVLDLAIACELAIKQALFSPETRAGEVFEYFEDRRRIRIGVLEFLEAAGRVFGSSFDQSDLEASRQLRMLFDCRNRIAHRGKAEFPGEGGWCAVDSQALKVWWESAAKLVQWLESRGPGTSQNQLA